MEVNVLWLFDDELETRLDARLVEDIPIKLVPSKRKTALAPPITNMETRMAATELLNSRQTSPAPY